MSWIANDVAWMLAKRIAREPGEVARLARLIRAGLRLYDWMTARMRKRLNPLEREENTKASETVRT